MTRFQPRLGMQEGRVEVIADSMRERGYDPTEPLHIWVDPVDAFPYVLSGHHRLAAAGRAGITEVTAHVFQGTEAEAAAFARRSNSQMAKLTPIEEARAFAREVQEGRSTQAIAKEYGGIKQSLVEDRLALNNLPSELQILVQDGTFKASLATALGRSAGKHGLSPEIQVQIFDRVVKNMEVTPAELSRMIDTIAPRAQENIQMGLGFNLERGFVEPLMEMTRAARELQRSKRRMGGFLKQVDEYRKGGKPIPKNLERARGAAQAEIRRLEREVGALEKNLAIGRKPTMKQALKEPSTFSQVATEVLPRRTLLIQRGTKGGVRVEFPDELHADLFSFTGRARRFVRGEGGRPPKGEATRLQSALGLTKEGFGKAAADFRQEVLDSIKGLPEGEKFVAPRAKGTVVRMARAKPSAEKAPPAGPGGAIQEAIEKAKTQRADIEAEAARRGAKLPEGFRESFGDVERAVEPAVARQGAAEQLARETAEFEKAGTEQARRIDAERVTEELKAPTSERLDVGQKPIDESPLFGGERQKGMSASTKAAEGEPSLEPPEGFISANPVFDPRLWRMADAFISNKVTKPLAKKLEGYIGKLPEGIQKWLRSSFGRFPEVKKIFEESRLELGNIKNEAEALRRMWLRTKPTPEETVAFERILRGEPRDLQKAKLNPEQVGVLEKIRESAQRLTSERSALGLPTREEWLEGPKHWYPNFFEKRLGHYISGRLFGKSGSRVRPGKEAMGSTKARKTDRYWIADSSGRVIETAPGVKAIFKTREQAESFVRQRAGYWVTYFEKGSKGIKRKSFPALKERTKWVKAQGKNITPRKMGSTIYKVVEPMSLDQMIANGLVLDPALNISLGWSRQAELVSKTKFLSKLGEMDDVVKDVPTEGYVKLESLGFSLPQALGKFNPGVARLQTGYVYEPLARELSAFYGPGSPFSVAYRASEGSLRKWVTFRNPWRHVRQIFENELTTALTDSGAFLDKVDQGRAFIEYARAASGKTDVPYWQEYNNSKLAYTDLIRGEFEPMWKALGQDPVIKGANAPLSLTERLAIWAEGNHAGRALLKSDAFAQRAYRAEDQIYKWYRYSRYRRQGSTHEAAEKRTRDSYFDYSDVPVIVRQANRFIPFWTNVIFQYSRILSNQLRDYPASTMLRIAMLWYAQAFVREMMFEKSGLTEEDLKNMDQYGVNQTWDLILPWTDEKGRNLVLDLKWLIPFSEVALMRHVAVEEEPETGWIQTARRFTPMVAQAPLTLVSQATSFGRRVLRGAENRAQAAWKLARATALSALPGLLGQTWDRLYRNAKAGERVKKSTAVKTLIEPITGQVQRFFPEERVGLRKALIAKKTRQVSEELGRQRGSLIRGSITGETYRKAIENLEKRLREVAHAETLAVIEAFRRGDKEAGREAYDRLLETAYYPTREETNKAIDQLAALQDRLAYAKKSQLPEIIAMADRAINEYRETGPLHPLQTRRLDLAIASLSESEKEALGNWTKEQIEIARKRRVQSPPAPSIQREQIYAPRF